MDKIIEKLQNFNFTKIEAEVYVSLLKNGQLNGSQVSKLLGLSRTSVYSALDSLYEKGYVFMLSGEPTVYKVQDPKLLVKNIKEEYLNSIDYLENTITKFKIYGGQEQFWNIKGYDNFINNTKRLLLTAENEVYISTNFELQLFKEELNYLREKNVRVIIFSFEQLNVEGLDVEFYHHEYKETYSEGRRWMMVIDNQRSFIANENRYKEVFGTVTENALMVSITAEHIHHDIYLLKLKKKHNKDLVTEDILIKSNFEKKQI
jgi:sugar-specific transcriptional regulator TrmB